MEIKLLFKLLAGPIRPETCKFIRYRYRGNEKAETTRRAYSNVFFDWTAQSKKNPKFFLKQHRYIRWYIVSK